jgi:hypothetical protein
MTPEQALEAERASLLFHAALVAQGAQAVTDTLSLYDDVPPLVNVNSTQAVTKWLTTAVRYVMSRRLRARDMALAYYRYQRALTTALHDPARAEASVRVPPQPTRRTRACTSRRYRRPGG